MADGVDFVRRYALVFLQRTVFILFFAFFRKFCLCKCSKRVCLIFASVLLQSYLIHVSALWAFFNLQFAFFRKFCFCKCSKRVRLIFASVLLHSFLIHVSVLWGGQPAFCLFSKVLFPENVQPCLFNIFMRFVAKFPVALVPIVGGFALCNKIKQHLPIYFKTKRL